MSAHEWEATLDEFERTLTIQETACREGSIEDFASFAFPEVHTPIPLGLLDRVTGLMWRCSALEDALVAARDALREEIDRLGDAPHTTAAPAEPVYFDSRL